MYTLGLRRLSARLAAACLPACLPRCFASSIRLARCLRVRASFADRSAICGCFVRSRRARIRGDPATAGRSN